MDVGQLHTLTKHTNTPCERNSHSATIQNTKIRQYYLTFWQLLTIIFYYLYLSQFNSISQGPANEPNSSVM